MNDLSFAPGSDIAPSRTPNSAGSSRVARWDMDYSGLEAFFETLRAHGVVDLREYFDSCPDAVKEAQAQINIVRVNDCAVELLEAASGQDLMAGIAPMMLPESWAHVADHLIGVWNGHIPYSCEMRMATLRGAPRDILCTVIPPAIPGGFVEASFVDISGDRETVRALQRQNRRLRAMDEISDAVASYRDLQSVVQAITDAATEHSGAKMGAFFYNPSSADAGYYTLYALSGASKDAFANFEPPRESPLFEATFRGGEIVRSDDIRTDSRHETGKPLGRVPSGHFPVVSYLAVPVRSRSGEIHGALLLGHDLPGIFNEECEEIVSSMASRAAMAIENARLFESAQRGKAIIDSSEDAIISKDLNGIITSWNGSATRMFGYPEHEMIGQPIIRLIPEERLAEEDTIISHIREGIPVKHFETVRVRRDGSPIEISLSVSPVRDVNGTIIGASKIARDNTAQKRAAERQSLLLREMNHRIKNLFALASAVVALSARGAASAEELTTVVQSRLGALARAHELTLPPMGGDGQQPSTSLHALIGVILSPYAEHGAGARKRFEIEGEDIGLGGNAVTSFALLLHEFATNAAKYGALSHDGGWIGIQCSSQGNETLLGWQEHGGPAVVKPESEGFGSLLGRATVEGQLAGSIVREWTPDGLRIRLSAKTARLKDF